MKMPTLQGTVLMTTDAVGGVWDYSLELASNLLTCGIETVLVTMGPRPTNAQREKVQALNLFLEEGDFLLEWMPGSDRDIRRAGSWLLQLEKKIRPDLIHLNGYAHANLPWKAPCLVVAHSCVLSWWQAVKSCPAPAKWNAYARRVRRGLRVAARVVAPNRTMAHILQQLYGPLPHCRTIYNGRNPGDFPPQQKEEFIFSAGRLWDEGKNIAVLEEASVDLPWPVLVAGAVTQSGTGESRRTRVCLLGRVPHEEMTHWLGRAAIYALPARYEPFGLRILEAAFSGCALVLGDIPTLRELWRDAALFVPPEDPSALREALQTLILDPALRVDLARRACRQAMNYTSERMTRNYLSLYGELMDLDDQITIPSPASRAVPKPFLVKKWSFR
ncbi:glycosyltransferase family 4 protein [Desulfuromonas sp. TF]|uniref:glycosyltransferase family 4 protein n=1 Tax=Desulfuromonas sp. TF TaxID=1232410 RepID=UPI0003FA2F7C|nr:glycosyltransferase family 4 protein [Desulfuromonas sp. TF]